MVTYDQKRCTVYKYHANDSKINIRQFITFQI